MRNPVHGGASDAPGPPWRVARMKIGQRSTLPEQCTQETVDPPMMKRKRFLPRLVLFERLCRNFVEAGSLGLQEVLPGGRVPDLRMIVHADQNHVARQPGELNQPFWNADSALRIQLNPFGTGVEQALVIPHFDAIGRLFGDLASELFEPG